MLLIYSALFLLVFWKMKFARKAFFAEESFSRDVTDSIKGIFIWLVFLSHFASYVSYSARIDVLGHRISWHLGQLIVACFLFYSGYGVMEAIKKRGAGYVKPFPKNRIFKTLLHFDIAIILFWIVSLITKTHYSLPTIIKALFAWDVIGNSNWYIFVIIMLYLFTWIAFSLFKRNSKIAAVAVTVFTLLLIVFLKYAKTTHWYDTALCYVLGMWISIFKDSFIKILTKNNPVWLCFAIGSLVAFLVIFSLNVSGLFSFAKLLLKPLVFCLVIAIWLLKFKISNPVLAWSGRYTFELYILQRIPMILLKHFGVADINLYLYFALSLIATLLLAVAFRFCLSKLDGLLFAKKN